ncbi:rhodanese-like domain-containing protein [Colwellia sp. UCD-KL20]|uniref:rhodanese-like domain-containing protein n=1 Tax=Colwellia sp. UCD-KL20 TaxID=1917165 RepID=UPI000970DF08|nr:rhodanese-like domain-containing protein [Colwellia sp. UCD-KL20]
MFIKKLLSFALFSLLSLNVFAEQTPTISQAELMKLLTQPNDSSFIVLDVRTPQEFNAGHIKNAINVSHNTVKDNLSVLSKYKDKMVVVHCRSGKRALVAEHVLKENGFSNLRHLDGDMLGWVDAKLPLIKE